MAAFLNAIFMRKAKEAKECVDSAERMLQNAQEKINTLKRTKPFDLMREELIEIIKRVSYLNYKRGQYTVQHYGGELINQTESDLREAHKEIDDLVNEISLLIGPREGKSP